MNRSRRHAQDFTDSINEFRMSNTLIMENNTDSIDSSIPLDSLEFTTKVKSNPGSPILASGFNIRRDTSLGTSDTSTIENTCNILDETIYVPTSDSTTKSTIYMDLPIQKCETESTEPENNLTIQFDINSKTNTLEADKLSDNTILDTSKKNTTYEQPPSLTGIDEGIRMYKEFFQRLYQSYSHSPRKFTERLVTIIEESVVNSHYDTCNSTSLSKWMNDVEDMCKLIQNESMPDLLSVTMNVTSFKDEMSMKNDTPITPCNPPKSPLRKDVTPQNRLVRTCKKVYRKTPVRPFKITNNSTIKDTSASSTTYDFEQLEAELKLYYGENEQPKKSLVSETVLLERKRIQEMVERQFAALSESPANSPILNKIKTSMQTNINSEKSEINNQIEFSYNNTEDPKYMEDGIEEFKDNFERMDNLDKSLLLQVAEKRQRCLDTAIAVMEINSNSEIAQALSGNIAESNKDSFVTPSSNNNNESFINTLMNCTQYYNLLEKHKCLFVDGKNRSKELNIPKSPKTQKKSPNRANARQISSTPKFVRNKSTTKATNTPKRVPKIVVEFSKSALSDTNSNLTNEKKETYNKPRCFTTPGKKSPVKFVRTKKTYFPKMHSPTDDTTRLNREKSLTPKTIMKSPKLGTYFGKKPIVSPIAMYIKGEKTPLTRNIRGITNDMLLTPKQGERLEINLAPTEKSSPCTSKTPSNVLSLKKTPKSMLSLNQEGKSRPKRGTKLFTSPTFIKKSSTPRMKTLPRDEKENIPTSRLPQT